MGDFDFFQATPKSLLYLVECDLKTRQPSSGSKCQTRSNQTTSALFNQTTNGKLICSSFLVSLSSKLLRLYAFKAHFLAFLTRFSRYLMGARGSKKYF